MSLFTLQNAAHDEAEDFASSARLGWPLFFTTLGVLVLELSLTRLFSVVLFYHYAFLAICMALLGLSAGGVLARLLPRRLESAKHRQLMSFFCMAACVSLLPTLYLVLTTNIWLVTTWATFGQLAKLFFICTVPFGLAGFVIASVMAAGARHIPALYFFDLLGASLGCLLFVPLIGWLGGPNAVLAAGLIWCLAAMSWVVTTRSRALAGLVLLVTTGMSGLMIANRNGQIFDVWISHGAPRQGEVFSAWNAFSRVSVQKRTNGLLWIEIDGGAGTWIPAVDFGGLSGQQFAAWLWKTGPDLAFLHTRQPRCLIIGPGGGVDIARALSAGSTDVTAVEINPIIVNKVMLGRFRDYSYGLYARPDVHVYVEDGRTFIQRTTQTYDVIQLSQVDTWASTTSGAYALTENYLYTVDAVQGYFSRLSDDGILSISRWEFRKPRETVRLASVMLEALDRAKVPNPQDHIAVVLENLPEYPDGSVRMGTVLLQKRRFTPQQLERLSRQLQGTKMELAYAPGVEGTWPFTQLIRAADRRPFLETYEFDVTPVDDNRPFFFFMGRWRNAFRQLFEFDPSGDSVSTGAQFLLLAVLAMAAVAVSLFLFAPLLLFRRKSRPSREVFPYLLFCVALGLAYIGIEISLIQKFVVFLGQPVYSLTVVVFVLLLSSSLGSRASSRFPATTLGRRIRWVIAAIVSLVLLYAATLPWVTRALQAAPESLKLAVVAALMFPLGFLMGMPFPSGLRITARLQPDCIEWCWAVNAAATVLGSVLAILISVTQGITGTMLVAVASYGAAAWLIGRMRAPVAAARPGAAPAHVRYGALTPELTESEVRRS